MQPIYITDHGYATVVVERRRPDVLISGLISVGTDPKNLLTEHFDPSLGILCSDTPRDWQGHVAPTEDHVREVIDFARTVAGSILIHCGAGISRSSGFALAILADRMADPDLALKALDDAVRETFTRKLRFQQKDHHPNNRIVMHIDAICGFDGRLVEAFCKRYSERDFWQSVNGSDDPWELPL